MDYGKRPPLDEQKSLWEATVAAEGVTTDAGEGTGLSLVDAGLAGAGVNSFVSMMAIIHPGDPQNVDSRDITAFNDGTGGVTVASAFKGGQVAAGVPYKIVTFRFVPAEVAAIDAKLGAFTSVQNLKAILGDLSTTKRLGQILGLDETDTLKAILGAFTAAQNLKAILGDLSTTKRLGQILGGLDETDTLKAILGAFTAAQNLKAILGNLTTTKNLGGILGALDTTDNLKGILGAYTTAANLKAAIDALALEATLGTHDTDIKALLATIAGYLDTEIAAILAAVDTEVASILGLVDSGESAGPYSYLDAGGEQDVVEDTAVTRRRIWLEFSNRNMTQTGTFKIYRKVDGTNYDLYVTQAVTVGAGDDRAWDAEFTTNQAWKLTYEEGADEGADRAIPYNVITQVIE